MIFLLLFLPLFSFADVMNLNNFMPTRLEDASPVPKRSFDAQFSSAIAQGGKDVVIYRPNIRYGLTNDIQLESQATLLSGGDESGSGETDFSLLYRVFKGKSLPAVSLTPTLLLPSGKSQDEVELNMLVTVTYSLRGSEKKPETEVHVNLGSKTQRHRKIDERGSTENFALGLSHRLLPELAIVMDYVHEEDDEHKVNLQLAEIGLHTHLGKEFYLGLSYSQGFGLSQTKSGALLGLEKQFGP